MSAAAPERERIDAYLRSPDEVLAALGTDVRNGLSREQALERLEQYGPARSAARSGRGENPGTALDVVDDCAEANLQTGLCQPSPSHAPKAIAALPCSKDLLDAAANAVDWLIPGFKARQRFGFIPAPHGGDGET